MEHCCLCLLKLLTCSSLLDVIMKRLAGAALFLVLLPPFGSALLMKAWSRISSWTYSIIRISTWPSAGVVHNPKPYSHIGMCEPCLGSLPFFLVRLRRYSRTTLLYSTKPLWKLIIICLPLIILLATQKDLMGWTWTQFASNCCKTCGSNRVVDSPPLLRRWSSATCVRSYVRFVDIWCNAS